MIGLSMIVLFNLFSVPQKGEKEIIFSEFLAKVDAGEVDEVTIKENHITGRFKDGAKFRSYATTYPDLVDDLRAKNVKISVKPLDQNPWYVNFFFSWGPIIFLVLVWVFFMRQMQMGGNKAMSFGKAKAKLVSDKSVKITFSDVAGIEEAKAEVEEIIDFLKDPQKFSKLGGKIPKGVLLVGSPGTGKTLLAKAIAGEAGVPFFSISGSDFVEMFVGVGASRVRDLFDQAKKSAPCIIFIDEIDAVGRHRGAGLGGGHDEREQTLNQLLVEMDGFEGNVGIIIIAATNRPDVLDPALLRPGRFDRQVMVGLPDIKGREQILKVHMRKVPLHDDVRADLLARGTPGFSGADLANLVNEAALFAARRNKGQVEMQDFEDAKDKIFMGPERRSMVMREDERRNTAFHESGHAVVAMSLPKADPVHKVTIMPRGWALGLTWQLPEHDQLSNYRDKMLEEISILFGGRIAEEIFVGQMSTGAANDFERATKLARAMVTKYGMSDALGTMVYADDKDSGFGLQNKTISEATQQKVDAEIRRILDEQYGVARRILEDRREAVEAMSAALLEWETIDAEQVRAIMEGRKPSPPAGWVEKTARPGKDEDGGPSTAQVVGGPAEQT